MKDIIAAEAEFSRAGVLGIIDFCFTPYALGDAITWVQNAQVMAQKNGARPIDLVLVALPERPASRLQRHIGPHNYIQTLDDLMPAFLTCPSLRSVRVFQVRGSISQRLLGAIYAKTKSWPPLWSHFRGQLDYSSHRSINAFHAEKGWLPRLAPPRGFKHETEQFRQRYLNGKVPIVVNIRQSRLTPIPAAVERDSPADVWFEFFRTARTKWPQAIFVMVGNFNEWERRFSRLDNVRIPRLEGYGLGHELTLLLEGAPFIGTSSGFSAAATFGKSPYVITHIEHRAARFFEIPIGTARFPFALDSQWLSWERETPELLERLFGRLWDSTFDRKAAVP